MQINKVYQLPFDSERVYQTWVSSKTIIAPATSMDILPEVGGHYRLYMETAEYTASNLGRFLIVKPCTHLRYTWEWNGDGEITEIDVKFVPNKLGTQVVINHSGFTQQQSVTAHASGWGSYMQGLQVFMA